MAQKICKLLNLNINAGVGWRLNQLEIKSDIEHPSGFLILSDDDTEAWTLVNALSARAEALRLQNLHFRAAGA